MYMKFLDLRQLTRRPRAPQFSQRAAERYSPGADGQDTHSTFVAIVVGLEMDPISGNRSN